MHEHVCMHVIVQNGHHEDVGRYLAVFMELSEGYEKVTSYHYCIEMLYNCSDKYAQRNYSRDYGRHYCIHCNTHCTALHCTALHCSLLQSRTLVMVNAGATRNITSSPS